ncbi:Tfp pilus assembly protein PilF/uncharacterized caspase-like protein [Spirosoma lacussanchae]|uniref:tetratricopeptide repeat protein n=1 Tax=Spirosoma lacussanchae TaxID=1884249 RepID=UPI001486FBB2|nr:tetratricopeptide repeat protein [Spirosoma lacussanchae]
MYRLSYLVVGLLLLCEAVHAQQRSDSKGVVVISGAAPSTGQTWAVIVGISNYQFVDKLRYADKDAMAFHQFLASPAGGAVPLSNMKLLLNEKATTAQIEKALRDLIDLVNPGDRVILYFSGHGDQEFKTKAQRGFLLTYDTNHQLYQSTAYAIVFFQDFITTLSADKKATVQVYLDACRAGKLAGNEIGGLQLAGEQLAKQVANETKVMSCQSNEVSVEGEQWGGGRGAFSYHLVRGLQGLADADTNGQVTTRELERYLEDHVGPEAKPMQQTPFKVGDGNAPLAYVHGPTKAALLANRSLPSFAAVGGKGFVEAALTHADSSVWHRYRQFQQKLAQKQPENAIADYEWLATNPQVANTLPFLKRELAAALMDEGQMILNAVINDFKIDTIIIQEFRKKYDYVKQLNQQSVYMFLYDYIKRQDQQFRYAADLLGQGSAFYNPARARAAIFRGINAGFTKDNMAALTAFNQAVGFDSLAAVAYCFQGALLYEQKRNKEAEVAYRKALQMTPNWYLLLSSWGDFLAGQKRPSEAEAAYRKAIQLKPDKAEAYYNLGLVLADQNRPKEAEDAYRKAIQLDSNYTTAYNNLGYLLQNQARYAEAVSCFEAYCRLVPTDPDGWNQLGIQFLYLKQYDKAQPCFERMVTLEPSNKLAPYNLACLYSLQNQPDPALHWFEKSLQNGYNDFAHITKDSDLNNIRNTERFRALLTKYKP